MNPLKKIRHYFIGSALAQTDDVFEQVKIQVVFSFIVFFLLVNIPYNIIAFSLTPFHVVLATSSTLALAAGLIILKKANVKWAIYFYVFNHVAQIMTHFIMNSGRIDMEGMLFFLLIVLFGFLILGRKWGFGLLLIVLGMYFTGIYNVDSDHSLFLIPDKYADPVSTGAMRYFTVIPILLNVFLISQFVKARQKAEEQIHRQKILLEKSNSELELQKHDMISSINYARRIQYAVLPLEENIYRSIPLSFIYYKPRDIVSGDFFWFHEIDRDNYILVCADCTGHGVPGALMTVIGSNLLTQIITENKITNPSDILVELDKKIIATLKQEKEHYQIIQDGMDLSLLKVDKQKKEFIFTSAKRPAIFIRNKQMQEFKGSKNTLGGLRSGEKKFEEIKMNYEEDDIIYLFTDGITDQFGGVNNKKYTIKRFRELLMSICMLPVHEQKQKLESTITSWIGTNEQTDDITVTGIRF